MLHDAIARLRERTDAVIVAVSRGKDSLVCLDLCKRYFPRVEAYHMHLVAGLSFVENYLGYLERRYSITIDRIPHWWLSHALRQGTFRAISRTVPRVTIRDVQARQRERTGIEWIVSGEKMIDSLQRRGMMSSRGILDERAKVAYPLARWNNHQVYSYLRQHRVPLPPDYRILGCSWSCHLDGKPLSLIRENYPEDYAKIEAVFPFIGVEILRHQREAGQQTLIEAEERCRRRADREQARGEKEERARARAEARRRKRLAASQAAKLPRGARRAVTAEPGPLQPQDDRPPCEEASAGERPG